MIDSIGVTDATRMESGPAVKKLSLGTLTMAITAASLPLLAAFAPACAQDSSNLQQIKQENASLREELAALRERDRLRAEISTVRARIDREKNPGSTVTSPETVRAAYAADPGTAYKVIPVTAPVAPSWNGFYLGLAAGVRLDQNEASTTSVAGFAAGFPNFPLPGYPGVPLNLEGTSARVGPYLGLNRQVSPNWLVGIEGDWAWANKTVTANGMLYPIATSPEIFAQLGTPDTFSVKTSWDASARARVGYLVSPSVLLYATGGPAWIHLESTSTCANFGVALNVRSCFSVTAGGQLFTQAVITDSTTKIGWTLGGGVEAMIGSGWSVRADYRYSDYGTIRFTDTKRFTPFAAQIFGQDGFNVTYEQRMRTSTAMLGIAHKLDW
jgi:outer membrane immunogenic protein